MSRRVFALLLIVGLAGSGSTAAAHGQGVPFKGAFGFHVPPIELDPTAECQIHHQSFPDGNASHIGRFSSAGVTCGFNLRVVADPPFNPGGDPPYLVGEFTREATWTAANNDQLFTTQVGTLVTSLSDGGTGSRGVITIIGGTGRFAGATGQVAATRDAGASMVTFDGWISYDASDTSRRYDH